jgi:hypothetical protein
MAFLASKNSKAYRCHICDLFFTEEMTIEVHKLSHEISNLRRVLDLGLASLNRSLERVSGLKL